MSNDWSANNHWRWGHDNDGPITGPDGQPILAGVGDLGDTVISGGGTAPSGSSGDGGTGSSPVGGSGAGLVINVTYDQPVNTLPTGFVSAINYVVNYLESLFSTPTTVNIDVGFGEIGGQGMEANALGESESFLAGYNYSTIKSALAATDPSAAASLPASQPVSGSMWVSTAEAKALGLSLAQPAADLDGYVGFSSALPFSYDPNNRAVAGKYDFIGVAEHEFTELMGRIDLFNATLSDGTTTIPNTYSLLDMYHYTSSGVHTYTGTTPNYFSADSGHTNLIAFNSDASGDLGDWASSAGADSFLAFSPSGQTDVMSQADITTMNALGYQSAVLTPITIESAGSTSLVLQGGDYFLDPVGGGTGPTIKYGGAVIVASAGGWSPIGVEANGSGYEIAWKFSGQDLYSVWNADSNGNYVSNAISSVSGTDVAFEAIETSFHQDLNGDGTIGAPPGTTIETFGSTSLVLQGGDYFLDPVGGGTGPTIKYGGSVIVASAGGWSPIGVEANGSGYEIAWKFSGQDLYSVWHADSNGNYVSNAISSVSGTDVAFEAIETSFHQDLNGDGTIGAPPGTTIEAFGSTSLVLQGGDYFLDPVGGGTGPTVKYGGSVIVASADGWSPIGAEANGSGYEIAWKFSGQDLYSVWHADSNGNYVSNAISSVSGTDVAFEAIETSFHQDLNGDGTIGAPPGTTIEAFGSTSLVLQGGDYFLDPVGGGTGPTVKYGGSVIVASAGGWSPIGAEANGSGYEIAWKFSGQDLYSVWHADSNGNYVSNAISSVSGTDVAFEAIETSFHQDLNGDGTIGVPGTTIEAFGSTSLVLQGGDYFLDPVGGGTGPTIKYGGAVIVASAGGWSPIGVEANGSGYEIAWKFSGQDLYSVWNADSNGNYVSNAISSVSGTDVAFEAIETSFHQDLNGDGTVGVPAGGHSIASGQPASDAEVLGVGSPVQHHDLS